MRAGKHPFLITNLFVPMLMLIILVTPAGVSARHLADPILLTEPRNIGFLLAMAAVLIAGRGVHHPARGPGHTAENAPRPLESRTLDERQ